MSERERIIITPEHTSAAAEHHEARPKTHEKDQPVKHLNAHEVRQVVHETIQSDRRPNPIEQLEAAENAPQVAQPAQLNRELKQIALRRELKQIQRQLPAPQRALSRLIHQPVVRAVSEGAGKTVSRPSGLLGGGLVALLGTSGYLYLAKHIGFQYNYNIFLLLFVGGFGLGLVLEFVVYLFTSSRRKALD